MPTTGERGQASVELVALLPLALLLVALAWQAAVAGQAVWLSGAAARAAARSSLPPVLSHLVRIDTARDGAIDLSLGVPAIVGGGRLATVHTRARFAPQGEGAR